MAKIFNMASVSCEGKLEATSYTHKEWDRTIITFSGSGTCVGLHLTLEQMNELADVLAVAIREKRGDDGDVDVCDPCQDGTCEECNKLHGSVDEERLQCGSDMRYADELTAEEQALTTHDYKCDHSEVEPADGIIPAMCKACGVEL